MADVGEHTPTPLIKSFARTVVGYSHQKRDIVCQDASGRSDDPDCAWHIAVVSDGHGDPTCPRSDSGSRMAVDAALETLADFAKNIDVLDVMGRTLRDDLRVPSRRKTAMRRLTDALVYSWRKRVVEDYAVRSLTPEEKKLAGPEATALYERGENIEHLYGATLICALWVDDLLILIHQGDGVCRVLHPNGAMESPVPEDSRCFANVTTSLCDPDVAEGIRFAVIDLSESPIAACVLASDGVENSFASPILADGFFKGLLVDVTCGVVDENGDALDSVLSNLSQTGSGDDMSLAVLYDTAAISQASTVIAADVEKQQAEQRTRELKDKRVSMERKHEYLKERSTEAEHALHQQEASLEELREAIQKRREGEEQLGWSIDELQRERERREHEHWKSGFVFDLKRLFASSEVKQQYDAYDSEIAREIASLGEGIVKAKKAREEIRRTRIELEEALLRNEREFDGDAEQAMRDFEEYDARYRALENEIARLEGMIGSDEE